MLVARRKTGNKAEKRSRQRWIVGIVYVADWERYGCEAGYIWMRCGRGMKVRDTGHVRCAKYKSLQSFVPRAWASDLQTLKAVAK